MKIVMFGHAHRLGVVSGNRVIDLAAAAQASRSDDAETFVSLQHLIESGEQGLDLARRLEELYTREDDPDINLALESVVLQAPFPGRRFAFAGSNNADHVANALANRGQLVTAEQIRTKTRQGEPGGFWAVSDPVGTGAEIEIPSAADGLFDFEGELAIVLAHGGKRISAEDLARQTWGVCLVIDWSLRSENLAEMRRPFYAHKVFDSSISLGPWISVGEVDPENWVIETRVNGELRQRFDTADMIHSYGELLHQISRDLTLKPGDMLAGGTGPGTAIDATVVTEGAPTPRSLFLKPGDAVAVTGAELGSLSANIVG